MKRFLIIVAALVLSLPSCQKNLPSGKSETEELFTLEAFAPNIDGTKTHLDANTVNHDMTWVAGDAISVISESFFENNTPLEYTNYVYNLTSGAGKKSAIFSGTTAIPEGNFLAVYPSGKVFNILTHRYIYFNVPSSQTYAENGITDGVIPMFAHGNNPKSISFDYLGGILRFSLKTTSSTKTLSAITVSTNEICAGEIRSKLAQMKEENYAMNRFRTDEGAKVIFYSCGEGVEINTTPKQFNIAMFIGEYSNLIVSLIYSDGSKQTLKKPAQTIGAGKIHNQGDVVMAVDADSPISFYIDNDATEYNFNSLYLKTPSQKVVFNSSRAENAMTSSEFSEINAWLGNLPSAIDVDLSNVKYYKTTFEDNFKSNKKIKKLSLPTGITVLSDQCLRYCSNLTELVIPEGVTIIYGGIFMEATCINTVNLPSTCTKVGNYVFCKAAAITVASGNPNFHISNEALVGYDGTLYCYPDKSSTVNYVFGDDVTTIYSYAFSSAKNLRTLTISATSKLTAVKANAFSNSTYVNTITCNKTTPPTFESGADNDFARNGTLIVPTGRGLQYANAGWKSLVLNKNWTISDGTTVINSTNVLGDLTEE